MNTTLTDPNSELAPRRRKRGVIGFLGGATLVVALGAASAAVLTTNEIESEFALSNCLFKVAGTDSDLLGGTDVGDGYHISFDADAVETDPATGAVVLQEKLDVRMPAGHRTRSYDPFRIQAENCGTDFTVRLKADTVQNTLGEDTLEGNWGDKGVQMFLSKYALLDNEAPSSASFNNSQEWSESPLVVQQGQQPGEAAIAGLSDTSTLFDDSQLQIGFDFLSAQDADVDTNGIFRFRLVIQPIDPDNPDNPESQPPTATSTVDSEIWTDQNSNGLRDPGEAGISGVRASLTGAAGTYSATSGLDGRLRFIRVPDGNYVLSIGSTDRFISGLTISPTFNNNPNDGVVGDNNGEAVANGFESPAFIVIAGDPIKDSVGMAFEKGYDLAVIMTTESFDPKAEYGDQIVYNVTVTNQGSVPAGEHTVLWAAWGPVTYVSDSTGIVADNGYGGPPVPNSDYEAMWTFDDLAPFTSRTFEVVGAVDYAGAEDFRVDVFIESDSGDDIDSDPWSFNSSNGGQEYYDVWGGPWDDHNDPTVDRDGPDGRWDNWDGTTNLGACNPATDECDLEVGNRVFYDDARDGIYDAATDTPIEGVNVKAYDITGTVPVLVGSDTTDSNGFYTIDGFTPAQTNDYAVVIDSTELAAIESELLYPYIDQSANGPQLNVDNTHTGWYNPNSVDYQYQLPGTLNSRTELHGVISPLFGLGYNEVTNETETSTITQNWKSNLTFDFAFSNIDDDIFDDPNGNPQPEANRCTKHVVDGGGTIGDGIGTNPCTGYGVSGYTNNVQLVDSNRMRFMGAYQSNSDTLAAFFGVPELWTYGSCIQDRGTHPDTYSSGGQQTLTSYADSFDTEIPALAAVRFILEDTVGDGLHTTPGNTPYTIDGETYTLDQWWAAMWVFSHWVAQDEQAGGGQATIVTFPQSTTDPAINAAAEALYDIGNRYAGEWTLHGEVTSQTATTGTLVVKVRTAQYGEVIPAEFTDAPTFYNDDYPATVTINGVPGGGDGSIAVTGDPYDANGNSTIAFTKTAPATIGNEDIVATQSAPDNDMNIYFADGQWLTNFQFHTIRSDESHEGLYLFGGTLFYDNDGDGVYDRNSGDDPIVDQHVILQQRRIAPYIGAQWQTIDVAENTDANGNYIFTHGRGFDVGAEELYDLRVAVPSGGRFGPNQLISPTPTIRPERTYQTDDVNRAVSGTADWLLIENVDIIGDQPVGEADQPHVGETFDASLNSVHGEVTYTDEKINYTLDIGVLAPLS